jgi:hypothetical protein
MLGILWLLADSRYRNVPICAECWDHYGTITEMLIILRLALHFSYGPLWPAIMINFTGQMLGRDVCADWVSPYSAQLENS